MRRQVILALNALGMDNCPVNCDLMEKDGKIYVIEITGRAGGNCLPEIAGLYYGINYYEAIVRLAMDMDVKNLFAGESLRPAVLSHILTSDKDGILKQIHNENNPQPDLTDLSFNVSPGDEIRHYENGRDRLGQVILTGKNLQGCENRLVEVLSKISIEFIA
mgnify:FL=1